MNILPYCLAYFGGTTNTINNILFINVGEDIFKVSLLDKKRLGEYTVFHQNKAAHDGYWHQQFKARQLDWALFKLFSHSFNKTNNIPFNTQEDFKYFCRDSERYNKIKETL